MEIEDLINRRELASLSFNKEKEVIGYLRKMPENESFEIILEMIKQNSDISLVAAKKVLNKNKNKIQKKSRRKYFMIHRLRVMSYRASILVYQQILDTENLAP
ncbi:hypothetical protein [Roseofilum sp. Guam]|uniref:hypothetical protein n=1 Tax=Roseofilum sp. Guam TaxID=2821502 RepID=UPI001B2E2648|nr:hypothetical protein [Roseofilum sp. Guam]MBP0029353.1 hypothetical protein [Roseofilum sp. Guam]